MWKVSNLEANLLLQSNLYTADKRKKMMKGQTVQGLSFRKL